MEQPCGYIVACSVSGGVIVGSGSDMCKWKPASPVGLGLADGRNYKRAIGDSREGMHGYVSRPFLMLPVDKTAAEVHS